MWANIFLVPISCLQNNQQSCFSCILMEILWNSNSTVHYTCISSFIRTKGSHWGVSLLEYFISNRDCQAEATWGDVWYLAVHLQYLLYQSILSAIIIASPLARPPLRRAEASRDLHCPASRTSGARLVTRTFTSWMIQLNDTLSYFLLLSLLAFIPSA